GHQVIAHVELHARVLEGLEAALVGRELLGVGTLGAEEPAGDQEHDAQAGGHEQEQQDRQIFAKHARILTLRPWARPCRRSSVCRAAARWSIWCPRGDSNPHDSRRYHLKVVRLPIPPPGQVCLRSDAWIEGGRL